ncbi:MAG: hypothetical protein NT004_16495 [Bacteroidetes bacterium]|nr:hypothetical protein [Bacteroidota bacterium]
MNNLYSYHTFLFPFQWQFCGLEMKHKTLEERTCLKEFVKLFDHTPWKRGKYKTDTILRYNEYNYFYGMVREVLFDEGKVDLDEAIIANLMYDIAADAHTFNFKICIDSNKSLFKTYRLHIDSILLHIYSTGVGVLSLHLNNRFEDQNQPDDILNINQAGRRLYPPFFGMDPKLTGTDAQFGFNDFAKGLDYVKTKELAVEFSILSDSVHEDFHSYRNPENFSSNPFQIPRHISYLFQNIPFTVDESNFLDKEKKVYITPLIDDRMYVVCWYGNDEKSEELQSTIGNTQDGKRILAYQQDKWWYQFMFNDQRDPTCQNVEMRNELIEKHTYRRWSDYGTFFGVNRYSFVCLTGSLENLKRNNAHFLVNHVQTMYYKLCELCLVQRACLLRFSDEVAEISTMKDDKKNSLTNRVSNLYQQYLRFVNRIYFREVTAQEQGIELYDMLQEHMKIENNVKDLDHEIQELHNYVTLVEGQKQGRNIELLTIIGALFILPTFIINFVGMIVIPQIENQPFESWRALLILLPLLIGPVAYYFIDKKRAGKWMGWLILFALGVALASWVFMIININ